MASFWLPPHQHLQTSRCCSCRVLLLQVEGLMYTLSPWPLHTGTFSKTNISPCSHSRVHAKTGRRMRKTKIDPIQNNDVGLCAREPPLLLLQHLFDPYGCFFSYFFFVLFLLFVFVVLGCIWCSLSMAKESSSLPFAPSTFHSMLSDCGGHPSPAPPPLGISVACEGPLLMHCALRLLSSCVLNANACVGESGWCGRERLLRLYMSCGLCCALLYCLFRRQGDR